MPKNNNEITVSENLYFSYIQWNVFELVILYAAVTGNGVSRKKYVKIVKLSATGYVDDFR